MKLATEEEEEEKGEEEESLPLLHALAPTTEMLRRRNLEWRGEGDNAKTTSSSSSPPGEALEEGFKTLVPSSLLEAGSRTHMHCCTLYMKCVFCGKCISVVNIS